MEVDQPELDADLLMASLRADMSDTAALAEALAAKLESALPRRTSVQRRRSGLRGPKRVTRIVILLDDQQLELLADDGALELMRSAISGGIVLKHERLDSDEWLLSLGQALANEARRSEQTRLALQRLVM